MERPSHYLDVLLRQGEVAHEIHARLLLRVHQGNAHGLKLSCAWPDWHERPGEFGMLFRVFGSTPHLDQYVRTIAPLVRAGFVQDSVVRPVPEEVSQILFVRDRRPDKKSPSAAVRLARRAAARGEAAHGQSASGPVTPPHFLILPSQSGSRLFRMNIRRLSHGHPARGGDGYGLGSPVPNF